MISENISTLLTGDVVKSVAKLKHELDGDIVVYASAQLGHTLMESTTWSTRCGS